MSDLSKLKLFKDLNEVFADGPSAEKKQVTAISVSALTNSIRNKLEVEFSSVYVEGELSNVSRPSSGHIYATLKDEKSQISIVIFRNVASRLKFQLKDGLEVILKGSVTVYTQRGNYQIIVNSLEPKGVGALQLSFEQLKEKLLKEGLFEHKRKRPIPLLPKAIGLVTSLTGAAIKDFLSTIQKRCPIIDVIIVPVKVQGDGSAIEIAAAIQKLNLHKQVDVIVVGRGGGSLEDLWSFNEEIVARSIFHSEIPVISAVGHEIDVSISDFVADAKAMTPTHAGVMCSPDLKELKLHLTTLEKTMHKDLSSKLQRYRQKLSLFKKLVTPRMIYNKIQQNYQRLDHLEVKLKSLLFQTFQEEKTRYEGLATRFEALKKSQFQKVQLLRTQLEQKEVVILRSTQRRLAEKKNKIKQMAQSLEYLSPLKIMNRGYSITSHQKKIVDSVEQVVVGSIIETKIKDGSILSKVEEVKGE